ncbi:DUF4260 domain-containing protein [Variovorax sp. OV329]|uniref:DUF4260 domain-containing protein n=1 Tax=Variovorax sp. OV329 TaxID=1882825 RepID=UPI0008E04E12|nr:DUF4260 domain-containing protein [Variovorax sp. OV329]SFM96766.1 protein of unknown function [Variovorax sp. OV329]
MAEATGFGAVERVEATPVVAPRIRPAIQPAGAAGGGVRLLLRLEGVALLLIAMAAYARFGGEWSFFAWTFLLPDLALLAYLAGPRTGAAIYNATHSLVVPAVLLAVGLAADLSPAFDLALVWAAHIGLDRALGFGLKYARGFAHTHLGQLGPVDPW